MAIPCVPARVARTVRLTPGMIRITFEPVGEWRWHTTGRGDERMDIAIPRPGDTEADLVTFNLPEYGLGWVGEEPPWRHYTVRRVHDGGRSFDIDFVVHEGGIASAWAERAEPGHIIGVFGAEHAERSASYYSPNPDADFQLLVADATGLPGLGRIVEELPVEAVGRAIIEVATEADVQELMAPPGIEFEWHIGSGNGIAPSALDGAVAQLPDPGVPWYAWVACEAATSRAIRKDLRSRLGLARNRHNVIGYWTLNLAGDMPAEVDS